MVGAMDYCILHQNFGCGVYDPLDQSDNERLERP